jgi:catechol 2,3-dioxygenase-like lactoylglutathione lyase family enzyme
VIDHLSLGVADLERAAALYDAALGALGYVRLAQNPRSVCYGPPGFTGEAPFAILHVGPSANPANRGLHLALSAPSRAAVDDFHAAALRHGALDDGPPGTRAHYGPGYYAAFVIDLDGHRIEAVVHEGIA